MKNIFLFLLGFLCFGCAQKGNVKEKTMVLTGQPTWFPLGGEIYHAEGLATAEEGLLVFKSESRWFKSFPKAVSKKEYEEWLKENPDINDMQNERGSVFFIPSKLPYPKNLESLSLKNQGASLLFAISNGANENELIFNLTLIASERVIIREIEHRFTNMLPILFAFYLDGKAVNIPLNSWGYSGGTNSFIDLVPVNQKKEWHLRVDRNSIDKLVGLEGKELEIVASFSERQYIGYFEDSVSPMEDTVILKGHAPQIILRSNIVKLIRVGGWTIEK